MKIYRWIVMVMIAVLALGNMGQALKPTGVNFSKDEAAIAQHPEDLIRFHVLANSDSEEDQALKRAVRDAILEEVSPRLAESKSLEESRQILTGMRPEIEQIAQAVVGAWGKTYEVKTDYGYFTFPTKSYGSLVLPAGEYEAVRVLIGKAEGSNWWCVLFPPLCFVDIEHSTAVQVDGKPGVPIQKKNTHPQSIRTEDAKSKIPTKPEVKFWIWEKLKP